MSPNHGQHVEEMRRELFPFLRDSVVAIGSTRQDGSDLYPHGTATLFAVSDHHFLVSAAHVITSMFPLDGTVCAFTPGEIDPGNNRTRVNAVPILGQAYRIDELPDVAVIHLKVETADRLSHCRFLRLNDVGLRPEPLGCAWVHGYPNETIQEMEAGARALMPFTLLSRIAPDGDYNLEDYDRDVHLLLFANRSDVMWSDGRGPAFMPERLHGISGSSVWQTWWPSRGGMDEQRARGVKIIGVQIGQYKSYIKATRWGCVAELIRSAFPNLRSVLGWQLGPGFGA
jgi:hypothetical protein